MDRGTFALAECRHLQAPKGTFVLLARRIRRPVIRGKLARCNHALAILQSLDAKQRYSMADIDQARKINEEFPEVFRRAASDRLRDAIKTHRWLEEESLRERVVPQQWLADVLAVMDPKTPTKDLRAAAARLRKRCENLPIPDLARVFGPVNKRGRKLKNETRKQITLAGDLSYEGLNQREMAPYLGNKGKLRSNSESYEDTRKLWNRFRSRIEARKRWRKLYP